MRVLVIGGSKFLGYHLIEQALSMGYEVTAFNRGESAPEAMSALDVTWVKGDRDGQLDRLDEHGPWDVVIDTCASVPRLVEASCKLLSGRASSYVLISTISVYDDPVAGADESAPAFEECPDTEEILPETYGPLKRACERSAEQHFDGAVTSLRCGLLVGPRDYTFRLSYWVDRVTRFDRVLVPGSPARPLQFIDARDAAAFALRVGKDKASGIFNLTGPVQGLTMREFADALSEVAAREVEMCWAPEQFLEDHEVGPWVELPAWVPAEVGALELNIDRAIDAGLRTRPLVETLSAIREDLHARSFPDDGPGLTRERELALLSALDG